MAAASAAAGGEGKIAHEVRWLLSGFMAVMAGAEDPR